MSLLFLALTIWAISAVVMSVAWCLCRRANNLGYVDVVWAGLMALAALLAGALGNGAALPRGLVALFGGLWGTRLCLHLLERVLHEAEDGRYQALRSAWNDDAGKIFGFFQLQAVVVALFSLPFIAAATNMSNEFGFATALALAVWLLSLSGEALADRQLAVFRSDPVNRGRTCRAGLWAWSRHPNYFFEWLHWLAYVLLAVGSPLFGWSLIGPILMFAFLYRVSGIPWTEAQSLRSRGDDYRRYQQEVSAFFPWPPKRA